MTNIAHDLIYNKYIKSKEYERMSQVNVKGECKLYIIPIRSIIPNDYIFKKKYSAYDIKILSDSINKYGIIQPLIVRKISEEYYELITGYRRIQAAVNVGLYAVPCIVIKCTSKQAIMLSLADSIHCISSNSFELSKLYSNVINKQNLSIEELSLLTGKREADIQQILKLECFDSYERRLILYGNISDDAAVTIADIPSKKIRRSLLYQIYGKNIDHSGLLRLIEKNNIANKEISYKQKEIIIINDLRAFTNTISKAVDLMRKAGKDVVEERTETNNYIEYKIRINIRPQ